VIPEIDSPAHTQAWGRSPLLQNITLNCPGAPYTGQFDPTLDLTYKVLEDVLREVDAMFIDPIMHFGGDEVDLSCWNQRPEIKQWMTKNNLSSYDDLQIYYRNKQKLIWRKISTKNVVYWANEDINLPTQSDDYIQWWGVSKNVRQLENRTNNIILSNYDLTYLDIGYGGRTGMGYGTSIETWRQMYTFEPNVPNIKGKILGGEACLWSEVSSESSGSGPALSLNVCGIQR
jgi:hexosaminidase